VPQCQGKLIGRLNRLIRATLAFAREVAQGMTAEGRIATFEQRISADLLDVLNMADQARLEGRTGTANSVAGVRQSRPRCCAPMLSRAGGRDGGCDVPFGIAFKRPAGRSRKILQKIWRLQLNSPTASSAKGTSDISLLASPSETFRQEIRYALSTLSGTLGSYQAIPRRQPADSRPPRCFPVDDEFPTACKFFPAR
jgi:hypothetical protein